MGSGKGQSRRTRGGTPKVNDEVVLVADAKQKWQDFVNTGGVQETTLYEYYMKSPPVMPLDADYEKVVTELFKDAAAVGALTFSNQYGIEDFEFNIIHDKLEYTRRHRLMMSLKARPGRASTQLLSPYHYLERGVTMSSSHVTSF